MNKNGVKLLAAVMIMTMVVAGTAIVFSDESVDAATSDLTITNGVYTAESETVEYTLDTTIDSSTTGIQSSALKFSKAETVESATITLKMTATESLKTMFDGINITVDEGVTLILVMDSATELAKDAGCHIIEDGTLTINGAVEFQQSTKAPGQTWYNSSVDDSYDLVMNGASKLTFNAANGISNVNADLNGTASITVQKAQFANLTFNKLDMESGTSVRIVDGDSSKTNMNIGADSTIAGTVDANNSNIYFTSGITITNTGGSISANQMKVLKPSGNTTPTLTINGGSVSGEFIPATDGTGEGASTIATTVTLNGVSVNNVTYADGVSLGEGSTVTMSGNLGIGDTINADLTVEDLAYLTDDLTIPEGKTLTISGYGTLDMLNHNITIEGTLVIERNGVVTSSVTGGENGIVLTRTGTIQNNGILGDTNTVTITGEGAADQKVSMKGVSGLSVNLARNGSNYYLAVSGDVSRISGMDAEIALYKVTVTDAMTIGKNVNFTATDVTIGNNVTFTNNGTATTQATFSLGNGASIVVVGSTPATITAETGKIQKDGSIDGETEITLNNNVKGVTVSVGRVTVPTATESYLDQRMYITGSTDRIADPDKDA